GPCRWRCTRAPGSGTFQWRNGDSRDTGSRSSRRRSPARWLGPWPAGRFPAPGRRAAGRQAGATAGTGDGSQALRRQYLGTSISGSAVVELRNTLLKAIGAVGGLQLGLAAAVLVAQQAGPLFPAAPTGMGTDVAEIIPADVEARITTQLTRLRDSTGGEVAIVTLPDLGDHEASDVALDIGRSWGVGGKYPVGDRRRNAGAVLLVVPRTEDHGGTVYLASGQGTEGFLTDAMAGRIIDEMIPAL